MHNKELSEFIKSISISLNITGGSLTEETEHNISIVNSCRDKILIHQKKRK